MLLANAKRARNMPNFNNATSDGKNLGFLDKVFRFLGFLGFLGF